MGGAVTFVKDGDIIVEYPQDTVRPMIVLKSPFFDGTGTNPVMLEDKPRGDKPNDVGTESKDKCNEVEKVCKSGLIVLKDHPKPTIKIEPVAGGVPIIFWMMFAAVIAVGIAEKVGVFKVQQASG